MNECTFHPKIEGKVLKDKIDPKTSIKGYNEMVNRYRSASREKMLINENIEKSACGANYLNTRDQKVKPFNLSSRKVKDVKCKIVEITLKPGKTVSMKLLETDDVNTLAKKFADTYQLSTEHREVLEVNIEKELKILKSQKT